MIEQTEPTASPVPVEQVETAPNKTAPNETAPNAPHRDAPRRDAPRRDAIVLFGAAFVPLVCWWLAMYPGLFSPDSGNALVQVRTGKWDNWHTTANIAWTYVATLRGKYPALVTLLQAVMIAAAFAYLGIATLRSGLRRRSVAASIAALCALPQVGAFVSTAWKDIPFTAGVLLAFGVLWRRTQQDRYTRADLLVFFTSMFLIGAFRWDGPIAAGLIVAWVVFRAVGQRVAVAAAGAGGLLLAVASLLLPAQLNLMTGEGWLFFNSGRVHDIAVVANRNPEQLSAGDWATLNRIMPTADWKVAGNTCLTHDVLMFGVLPARGQSAYTAIDRYQSELGSIWTHLLTSHPWSVLSTHLCRAESSVMPVPIRRGLPPALWVEKLPATTGITRDWRIPVVSGAAFTLEESANTNPLVQWALFHAPPWLIATFGLMIFGRRRIQRELLRAVASVFVLALPIIASAAVSSVAQDLRYTLSATIVLQYACLMLVAALFTRDAPTLEAGEASEQSAQLEQFEPGVESGVEPNGESGDEPDGESIYQPTCGVPA